QNATLEEAVEYEMRAAMRSGIDGFQFYYTLGNDEWEKHNAHIIKTYFKVAKEKKLNFKLTFCFAHPSGMDENTKVAKLAGRVKKIMDSVGKNDPNWLRTPDGRLIVYLWYGEQLADLPPENQRKGLSPQFYAARAYKKLADVVGDKFA